ncbi:hypothetical protein Tco_1188100, partial [Tanacetum coccineum]
VNMDDPNITMEEYIRLEKEKAHRRVFDDAFTSKETHSCEPTVSSLNNNEFDFRISFDESDDKDYTEQKSFWEGNLPKLPIILKYSALGYLMYSGGKLRSSFELGEVLGGGEGSANQGGDELVLLGVQVDKVVTRSSSGSSSLYATGHWADPFKDLKWSNVPGVKLSSLFESDETFPRKRISEKWTKTKPNNKTEHENVKSVKSQSQKVKVNQSQPRQS